MQAGISWVTQANYVLQQKLDVHKSEMSQFSAKAVLCY